MKVLQTVVENEEEGFMALIGQEIEVFCGGYIYAGVLVGVNTSCIKLASPHIVYETGSFPDGIYKDAQSMCKPYQYVQQHAIESFGISTKLKNHISKS